MTTHLYTVCWDEADMLGFFFRHYDPWVDRYVIYDDGSMDGSLEILRAHPQVELRQLQRVDADSFVVSHTQMQERAWKESRGQADWVVITAIDEHLWVRGREMCRYLRDQSAAGVTCVPALGFDMNSEEFPSDTGLLIETVTRGRARRFFNKLSIFNPDAIEEARFVEGRHSAAPTGNIVFPSRDELLLWHYKHLGFDRVAARHDAQGARLGSKDRANGWGHRYLWSRDRLAWQWRAMHATSTDLAKLIDPALSCERPLWWRPEQTLSHFLGQRALGSSSVSQKPPRVSVVVKSFNHEKYIRHCIQSVLNQTFQDFELIVTDDASTDDTAAVVRTFCDSRIKLHQLPHNLGISGAMNAALSRASGEYIAILNSDDWALPDRLETQVAFMDAHPDVGVVFGMPTFVDDRDELTNGFNDFRLPLGFSDFSRQTWLCHFFFHGNCLCAPTAMIRREVIRRVGDYDVRLTNLQDLDYWVRVVLAGFSLFVEDREVTAFRIRDGQRNVSAPRTDTALRGDFEYLQILHHFKSIDPDLLADVPADHHLSPAARLAKLAFSAGDAVHFHFALQMLHEHADGPADMSLLRELAGSADIYGRLAKAELSHKIGVLEAELKEARHQVEQVTQPESNSHPNGTPGTKSSEVEAELARLLGSRSWRYTEGLRHLYGMIQGVRRHVAGPQSCEVASTEPATPESEDIPCPSRRVFDCFFYAGQTAALVTRLRRLNGIVDVFIVASPQEEGVPSRYGKFNPFDHRVGPFMSKVRYVPVTDVDVDGWKSWEYHAVWRGAPDAAATDLFLLSDVSELPSVEAVAEIAASGDAEAFGLRPARAIIPWRYGQTRIVAATRRKLEGNSPAELRGAISQAAAGEAVAKLDVSALLNSVGPRRAIDRKGESPLDRSPGDSIPTNSRNERQVEAILAGRSEGRIRKSGRSKLPPVVICPYLYSREESEIRRKFGLDNGASRRMEFFLWRDEHGIGPELAFEHCWERFPERDIVIVHSDMAPMTGDPIARWYDALVGLSGQLPEAGMLGCNLYYNQLGGSGSPIVQSAGGTFTNCKIGWIRGPLDEPGGVSHQMLNQVRIVDWVTFGGVLVRREVIKACGRFDRRYQWAYVMDVDYCFEARLRGFQLAQVPVSLQHEESRTTRALMKQNPDLVNDMLTNFEQFYTKWRPFYPLLVQPDPGQPTSKLPDRATDNLPMPLEVLA